MSKSKKPRNKKYNPQKSQATYLNHFAKKLVIEAWDSDQIPSHDGDYTCNMPQHILAHAVHNSFKWVIQLVVKCETDDGERYEEIREVATQEPVKINDLHAFALAQLEEAEKSVNAKHLRDRGWMARILTPALERQRDAEVEAA